MHEDFGSRIRVKINAPELLEKYLQKRGFLPINRKKTGTLVDYMPDRKERLAISQEGKFPIGISGGVCDIYQPAEEEVKMSRKMLQIVYDYGFPVFLLTKNKLVLRDLDLLKKINENAGANVSVTVTLADDALRKIFEPNASTTEERFGVIRTVRNEGISSDIWFLPILPWIGDSDENIGAVFERAKEADVNAIYPGGLSLKPGRQKDEFFRTLEEHFPELVDKYSELYSNNHKYGSPDHLKYKDFGLDCLDKCIFYSKKYHVPLGEW
jgi:DNA repair photolyase